MGNRGLHAQEAAKAEGKGRIVDLRFGNVKANVQSLRIRYQEGEFGYILKS